MRPGPILTLALLAQGMVAGCSEGNPLDIVKDGVSKATIVVGSADRDATKAASQIQHFIEQMSGAKLPVVSEGETVEGIGIYV